MRNHPIGDVRILWQERTVQIGTDNVTITGAFTAINIIVAYTLDDVAERCGILAKRS